MPFPGVVRIQRIRPGHYPRLAENDGGHPPGRVIWGKMQIKTPEILKYQTKMTFFT
jgi:hypothetical protein